MNLQHRKNSQDADLESSCALLGKLVGDKDWVMESLAAVVASGYIEIWHSMNTVLSSREKAIASNTLLCLLQELIGQRTTVELRNESVVKGTVAFVDTAMNVSMCEVEFTNHNNTTTELDVFYIRGKNIRYVHIPDEINIVKTLSSRFGPKKKKVERVRKRENRFGIISKALLKQQQQGDQAGTSTSSTNQQ